MANQISGWLSPYLRRIRKRQVRPYLGSGTVLDFGCGTGSLAQAVDARRYVGVDIDSDSLEQARSRHPDHLFLQPGELSATPPREFDLIVALAVIEHLPDPLDWLRAMKTRLRPGGTVVLTTPHPSFIWLHELGARAGLCSREAAEEHNEFFDRISMERLAQRAELTLTRYERFLLGANQLFELRRQPSELD